LVRVRHVGYAGDGMNVYRFLSRLFFLIAVGCFIAAGWLWWDARAAEPLVIDAPEIDLGVVTQKEPRIVEIAVTNRGPAPLRLAGLDNELC